MYTVDHDVQELVDTVRRVVARAASGLPSGAGPATGHHAERARKIGGRKSQHETERRASLEPPAHGPRAIDGAFEEVLQDMLAAGAVSRAGAGPFRNPKLPASG